MDLSLHVGPYKVGRLVVRATDGQLGLPFDQHQRYRIIADVIERLRDSEDPLRVLEVGGGESALHSFLPGDQVTILDPSEAESSAVSRQGDDASLPFDDDAFDYVVSVDVHEHLEPGAWETHLDRIRRIAHRGVLLSAPFDSTAVRGARRMADEFHRAMNPAGSTPREQAASVLPDLDDARRLFEGHRDTVSVLPNGYIPHWLAMTCLSSYGPKLEGGTSDLLTHVNAFYNESMYEYDNVEPCYRRLLVALKGSVNADLDGIVSSGRDPEHASRSTALFGTLSAILPLAAEVRQANARIAQYERRIARREGDLARKEAQVNDLSRRLADRVNAKNTRWAQMGQRIGGLQREQSSLQREQNNLRGERDQMRQQLTSVTNSRGWKVLTALHLFRMRLGRIAGSGKTKA